VLPAGPVVDDTGQLAQKLSHTKVFFDGISAPLLYASENEVSAVVPFGIQASNIQVQVQNGSQFSPNTPIAVAAAAPALYSRDGTAATSARSSIKTASRNSYGDPAPRVPSS